MLIDWLSKVHNTCNVIKYSCHIIMYEDQAKTAGNITDDFLRDEESARVKTT